MRKIIFGIRPSRLARAQLDEFIKYLVEKGMDMEFHIRTIKTRADYDKETPVERLGEDVFTKEIERALVAGEIDCAVHSLKDVAVEIAADTDLCCFLPRMDEKDCLVCRQDVFPRELKGLRVATESPRRGAFLREFEPRLKIFPLRGNVDTRIKKLQRQEFDAMVLAACGLKRLGQAHRISLYLDSDTFVPAAGQGAICAQTRQDDTELNSALRSLSCQDTELAVKAERAVLKELGAGCRMPLGVFARFTDRNFVITAKLFMEEKGSYAYCKLQGPGEKHTAITYELINSIKDQIKGVSLKCG